MRHHSEFGALGSERLIAPGYEICFLTTPSELQEAAALDYQTFSEARPAVAGNEVNQPYVDLPGYHRATKLGYILGLRANGHPELPDGVLEGFAAILVHPDPESDEPLLRYLKPGDGYLWVSGLKKEVRGQGLGGALLDARLDIARSLGLQRVFTVVHPTNLNSIGNLNSRGFVGIGSQQIYYLLSGRDGMRIVMLNGDINNPNWVTEKIGTTLSPLEVFEANITAGEVDPSMEPETPSLNYPKPIPYDHRVTHTSFETILDFLESGLCIKKVDRSPVNSAYIRYHLGAFKEDAGQLLAERLYPYSTLLEAYQTDSPQQATPQLSTLIAEKILGLLDNHPLYPNTLLYNPKRFHGQILLSRRLFTDWLIGYHKNVMSDVAPEQVLPPELTGELFTLPLIQQLKDTFIVFEHDALRAFINWLPPRHPLQSQVNKLDMDAVPHTKQSLTAWNAQAYRAISTYPLERLLGYDYLFPESRFAARIAYVLGRIRHARQRRRG